jgi:hypothetical protein
MTRRTRIGSSQPDRRRSRARREIGDCRARYLSADALAADGGQRAWQSRVR